MTITVLLRSATHE